MCMAQVFRAQCFGVEGSMFRGLGFDVYGAGSRIGVPLALRLDARQLVWHLPGRVQGAGCRVQGARCRVQGAGCRV